MDAQAEQASEPFADLAAPHLPSLRRYAAVLVGAADADDLVQEALARAWRKREGFDPARGTMLGWLLAIVRDRARGLRSQPVHVSLGDLDRPVAATDAATIDLRRAVDRLPERQRAAVVLFHYVDLPVAEIATVLGCSVGTVKSALHDARRNLARDLGADYARDR